MDLKSFYKKIDVDSIKNKLPPIKIPKIKSRKIFKSSREDLAQQQSPADAMSVGSPIAPKPLPGQSSFIDRTPTRISTVSSLMNINYGFKDKQDSGRSTYKTANNYEEENCPDEFDTREPVSSGNSVGRFGDKCKKTYKDFSEFKIKNIFAKKTVVKKTEIEVDIYARQYERDNYLEEQDLENQLEESGYAFEFKEARRRLSMSSTDISPPDSVASGVPSPIRSELAHLQRNQTPPLLAKRRNAISEAELKRQKFHRSVSSESNDEPPRKPNRSSLWGLNEHTEAESGEEQLQVHRTYDSKLSKFKKSMTEGIRGSTSAGDSGDDQPRTGISRMAKFRKQARSGVSDDNNHPAESEEDHQPGPKKTGISRMARFKKSMKDGITEGFSEKHIPAESGDDQPSTATKSEPSRMARFKKSMKEGISEGFSDKNMTAESGDEQQQAVHKTATSRMARFKKSMKDGIAEGFSDKHIPAESGDDQPTSNKAGPSRMARFKKSMQEGLSEGFSDKHMPAESGEDQAPTNKAAPSRMARFKKSMQGSMSEGISDKNTATESGDDQPSQTQKNISRMARFKKSMKEGISDKHIPEESEDDRPSTKKTGTSRISKLKASMMEGMSDKNTPTESGDDQPSKTTSESRMSKFKKSMKEGMSQDFDSTWNLKGIRNRFASEDPRAEPKPNRNLQSQESLDEHSDLEKKPWKLSNIHLRRGESTEKCSDAAISSPEDKFSGIKKSINRLKNRKSQRQTSEESETEQHEESPKQNMSDQLKAGLRRLKMRERSATFDEEESKIPKEPVTSRLQNWKKSIKMKRPSDVSTEDNDGEAPQQSSSSSPLGRSHTLMRKLNHIRSRKVGSEDEADNVDSSQGNDKQKQKSTNLEKLDQARTKALQKVNAQVQKMKNFHGKSRDLPSETSPEKPNRKNKPENISKPLTTVMSSNSLESQLSLDENEEIPKLYPQVAPRKTNKPEHGAKGSTSKPAILASSNSVESTLSLDDEEDIPKVHTVQALRKNNKSEHWTKDKISRPSLGKSHLMQSSLSFEEDDDDDQEEEEDIPKVFLHQDSSDNYESTLTVAVTRRAPPVPTAVIKETIPKTKYQAPKTEWIPNKNAISSFLEMTPSPESSNQQLDVNSRGHLRKRSMDSNDSDSWIPDYFRNKNCSSSTIAGLNKISENTSEPWKVHSVFSEEKLYKAKSIDIFANRDGGAFKDFDDEMKNVPVRRITAESAESLNKSCDDSTDDDDDYDNASKITRLKYESSMVSTKAAIETIRNGNSYEGAESNTAVPNKKAAQIGNSQESLDANYDENEEISSEDDEEEEDYDDDETPTMAPSPPPSFSPPPPPLPLRKPPRIVPERNDSMVRLAHPLVKQGSLRRHFSEEIEPSDLGKVNKLITRFEKTPNYENVPRIQLIASDDDDGSLEVELEVKIDEPKPVKTKENGAKKRSVQLPTNIARGDDHCNSEEKYDLQTKDNGGSGKKGQTRNGTSDEEGNFEQKKITRNSCKRRPAPIPNNPQPVKMDDSRKNNDNNHTENNNNSKINDDTNDIRTKEEHRGAPSPEYQENLDNVSIQSPNSIYGSPIGSICLSERISTSSVYGSPIGVAYPTSTSDRQVRSNRRLSNRSSLRDDDTFYSFESDEENNFYSLGDSSDMRYVIEI